MTRVQSPAIVGFVIVEVGGGSQLNLHLQSKDSVDSAVVRIGGPFLLSVSSGAPYTLVGDSGGGDRSSLGVCLNLYGSTVTAVHVSEAGALNLEGLGGSVLENRQWTIDVPSDQRFEAWEIATHGQERARIISMPGGGLA